MVVVGETIMKFISLFTGLGGIDIGLERAGMQCVAQVENNSYCQKILARHYPEVPRYGDIELVSGYRLPCADLYAGGDPCQVNSNAKTHGRTAEALGGQFIRLIDERRPRFVLRENPSVVRKDAPWPWWKFRAELERLGYAVLPFRLRACCAGADHRRERLFLLAELQNADSARLEGHEREVVARTREGRQDADIARPDRWSATPRICRATDGIPNRVERLKGLGNAGVPQVIEVIGRSIMQHSQDNP